MKKKSGRRVSAARLLLCTLLCFLFAGGIKAEAGMLVTAADPSLSGNTGEEQRSKEEYFADLQAEPVTEPEQTPSRFVTVTLHAGRYGYFDDPSVREKESLQFKGEAFTESTVPDPLEKSMVFAGWARKPDAAEADVTPDVTPVSLIGTDLYAVWTDECQVHYTVEGGFIEGEEGSRYGAVLMRYQRDAAFQVLTPKPYDEQAFDFDGWYTGRLGAGEAFTADTVITEPYTVVYAKWKLAGDRIEQAEPDREYSLSLNGNGSYFAFTPEETTVYAITAEAGDSDAEAYLAVMDVDQHVLAAAEPDEAHNASVLLEMKAGETYFWNIREMNGGSLNAKMMIQRADCVKVTFHAGRADAWFGEEKAAEAAKDVPSGSELQSFMQSGLTLDDEKQLQLLGWSVDPEAVSPDEKILAADGLELYAVIRELKSVRFEANGGWFGMNDGETVYDQAYAPGTPFLPEEEPRCQDKRLKFAGWSRDPQAAVPDEDLIEGVTPFEDVGDTLYAVYTEKVLETFRANGGYFLNDPSVTTCQSTKGKGHIFSGLAASHENSRFQAVGWEDQNGVFIPYTEDFDPYYHVEEDTIYTLVWAYKVNLDANGGSFPLFGTDKIAVPMEADGLFSLAEASEEIGACVAADDMQYFAGWASSPDAEEADVTEGITPVKGLDWVYAVWKKDSYILEEGGHASWEKGTPEGLRFVVKRAGDDRNTFSAFEGAYVDGELLADGFTAEEGSLILTLQPVYLETLAAGDHELMISLNGTQLKTTFTLTEKETEAATETAAQPEPESTEEAPVEKTFLPPYVWYGLGGAAVILLGVILISGRRKKNTAEDDNDPLELFLQERERREHEKHQDD